MITRGEQMLALRRRRMASTFPILRGGFRPFFFGGAAWGLIALTIWICTLAGEISLPSAFDPLSWHRHEMLFGFVGAIVAGFLLTAIPNWTGRLPIAGPPLASLFGLWLAARIAVLFSGEIGRLIPAVLDVGFYLTLALVGAREVLLSKNRNLPIVGMVLLFGLANATDHAGAAGLIGNSDLGWMFALSLVVLMISLIGGRITPSFTRNWLVKQGVTTGLPTQPARFDMAVIGATALALLAWITAPSGYVPGGLLLIAAALQVLRLARWSGVRTVSDPLVIILHVGYAWVPVGLGLLGASLIGAPIPRSAAIHALTAGAMTTMILAVMTRASLGHTGRELKANSATIAIYGLITLGALLRVTAPLQLLDYRPAIEAAGLAWGGALLLFLIAYAPVLWRPRLGETA
jgi:uncharacterized protein involved in response to NO